MHTKSIIVATIGVAGIANALPAIKRAEAGEQSWTDGGSLGGNLGEAIGDIVDASVNHHDNNGYRAGRCDPRYEYCGHDDYWKRDAQVDTSQSRRYRPQQYGSQQQNQYDPSQVDPSQRYRPQSNEDDPQDQVDPSQRYRPQQNEDDEGDDCQAQCIQYCQTFLNDDASQCAADCPQQCNAINSHSIVDPKGHASSDEAFCAIFDQYNDNNQLDPEELENSENQDGFRQFQSLQGGGRGNGRSSIETSQLQGQNQDDDGNDNGNQKRTLPGLDILNGIGGGGDQYQTSDQRVDNNNYGSGRGSGYRSNGYRLSSYGGDGGRTENYNNLENNQEQTSQGGGLLSPLSSLTSVTGGLTDSVLKKRDIPGVSLLNGIGGGGVQNQKSKQSVDNNGFGFDEFNPESELENNQVQTSQGGGTLNPFSSLTSLTGGEGGGIIKKRQDGGLNSLVGNPLSLLGNQRQRQNQNNRQSSENGDVDSTQLASQRLNSDDEDENDFGNQRLSTSQTGAGRGFTGSNTNQFGNQRFDPSQVDATGRGRQGGIGRGSFTGGPNRGLNNAGGGYRSGGVSGGVRQNSKCPLWVKQPQQQQRRPAPYKA